MKLLKCKGQSPQTTLVWHSKRSRSRAEVTREGQLADERSPGVTHNQSGRGKLLVTFEPSDNNVDHLLPGSPYLAVVCKLNRSKWAWKLAAELDPELIARHIAKLSL